MMDAAERTATGSSGGTLFHGGDVTALAPASAGLHHQMLLQSLLRQQEGQMQKQNTQDLQSALPKTMSVTPSVALPAGENAEPPNVVAGGVSVAGGVDRGFLDLVRKQRVEFDNYRTASATAIQAGAELDEASLRVLHNQYASQMQQVQAMANMLWSACQMKGLQSGLAQAAAFAGGGGATPSTAPNPHIGGFGGDSYSPYMSAMLHHQQHQHQQQHPHQYPHQYPHQHQQPRQHQHMCWT